MKFMQLYPPEKNTDIILTGQGKMQYLDFLKSEKKRIEKNPKRKVVLKTRLGFSWLMVDVVAVSKKNTGESYRQLMPLGQRKVQSVKLQMR